MTSAIARWHSGARPPSDALELAYADRLEAEMQELAIQLHKVSEKSWWAVDTGGRVHLQYSHLSSRGLETGNLKVDGVAKSQMNLGGRAS